MFARFLAKVRLLHHTHHRLRPPAFPTTSRPRLAGKAIEISRFPCKRLLRMPGSTTTRGRHVSRDIDTGRVAFCGTENISTPNLSYAAQYLACTLPCERFTSALADNPCITRGRCGSLLLHRDGLPPSTFCRSPGAPVHTINHREQLSGKPSATFQAHTRCSVWVPAFAGTTDERGAASLTPPFCGAAPGRRR